MEFGSDDVGIEFIPYKYVLQITNRNYLRLHAFDWLLLHLKDRFVVRYLPDWSDFAPMAIKLSTSDNDEWIPLTLKAQSVRPNKPAFLENSFKGHLRAFFRGNSIYRHHLLVCVCLRELEDEFKEETFKKSGGNLGAEWTGRFAGDPVETVAVYTQLADFHPTDAPAVNADRTISDPIPIVNPTSPPAQHAIGLNAVLQKVQDAIERRCDAEDFFKWDDLHVEPKL